MSTSSGIALRQGETYTTIYCHWDGHPQTMYPILRDYYNSFELVNKLISMGDASSIEAKIDPDPTKPHTFDKYQPDVCVFYHRDRGDSWLECQPTCFIWEELWKQPAFEWIYIFEDEQWSVYRNGRKVDLAIFNSGGKN